MKILKGKTALITGASGGIGRSIAVELGRAGCKLILNYHNNQSTILEEERLKSTTLLIVKADITNPREVRDMVSTAEKNFGPVDILINNAGISINGMSWKLEDYFFEQTVRTNLFGTFYCTKAVLPGMREKKWGRIINITSIVGQTGIAGASAYASSKAGIVGLTKSIAKEVANRNITVNALALGYFKTGMFLNLNEEFRKEIEKNIPTGNAGNPDDIGKTIVFLCSDAGKYITGTEININGGLPKIF